MIPDASQSRTHPERAPDGGPPRQAEPSARERLLDLAHDVSSYLRHHRRGAVRASAALLLAASLAACSPAAPPTVEDDELAEPLAQEVRTGLPSGAGRYPISPQSLGRDPQGVYHFGWQQPAAEPTGPWNPASVSLLKLAQSDRNELEVPAEGDPILHLQGDVPIPLVTSAADLSAPASGPPTPMPSSGGSPGVSSGGMGPSVFWFPFFGSTTTTSPAYYRNPPGQPVSEAGTVRGSTTSVTPPAPADRVTGLSYGVSGQAGGTGRGTAATLKSGGGSASAQGGAATGKSSGFSAGSGRGSSGGLGGFGGGG